MRDCIVHMQQIQLLSFKNLEHLCSQRQCIRWMIEQRIRRYLYLMKKNVRIVQVHPDRRGITDEMHVVSASRQLLAKFGGHNAGTAVSGITGYANEHSLFFLNLLQQG